MDEAAGLEWVERVLGVRMVANTAATATAPRKGGVEFAKLRLSWDDARKHLAGQLRSLKAAIIDQSADEDDAADIESNAGVIEAALAGLDDGLSDALDDLYIAGGADPKLMQTARTMALSYKTFIEADPLLQEIDGNPFVPLDARKRLDTALGAILAKL